MQNSITRDCEILEYWTRKTIPDGLIDEKRILLENRWEKIKDENHWGKLEKDSEKPNWICKDCYDGGVLLEVTK